MRQPPSYLTPIGDLPTTPADARVTAAAAGPRDEVESRRPSAPVRLRRFATAFEANLARAKLAAAEIPSFVAGDRVVTGDTGHPFPNREVDLYVPQSLLVSASQCLDEPIFVADAELAEADDGSGLSSAVGEASPTLGYAAPDDPLVAAVDGSADPRRAVGAALLGWILLAIPMVGMMIAPGIFAYAIRLAVRPRVPRRPLTAFLMAHCLIALAAASVGLIVCCAMLVVAVRQLLT